MPPVLPSQPVSEAARPAGQPSDWAIAATVLEAIRRIIAERNELRRERERLLGLNDELRRQSEEMSRLRDRYRQLATELLVQLRQMSLTIHEVSLKAAHDLSPDTEKGHDLSADSEQEKNSGLEELARRWDTEQEKDSGLEELARRFAAPGKAG